MKSITSTSNQHIKLIKKLHHKKYRKELGLFLLEGVKLLQEAIRDGITIHFICYPQDLHEKVTPFLPEKTEWFTVDPKIFKELSTTEEPTDVIAVAQRIYYTHEEIDTILREGEKIIILDGIQDPGNLGTLIRTCCGSGMDAVILAKGTVDLYNTKTVRAASGNLWKIPVFSISDITILKKHNYHIVMTSSHASKLYFDLQYHGKVAFIFGSEGHGISQDLAVIADESVKLPLVRGVESLNVASALSAVVYEVIRQRLIQSGT